MQFFNNNSKNYSYNALLILILACIKYITKTHIVVTEYSKKAIVIIIYCR